MKKPDGTGVRGARRGDAEMKEVLPEATLQKRAELGLEQTSLATHYSCFNTYYVASGPVPSPDKLVTSLVPSLTVRGNGLPPLYR